MTIRPWCNSSEKIALTRVVSLEYLLITRWIFSSRLLNGLELSARGWGYSTLLTDDHWKPPSTVRVRVCWNSWIRKWRVWCVSDRIQNNQIGSKIHIRLDPRYVSDPNYISNWIQDMYQTGSKISFGTPVQCVSLALSLVPASAFVTWPSCHAPLSHANVKACREMWRNVKTCHDVVTCHGMSFRAPACAAAVIPPDIYLASHLW